jgi:hypothetical protein
MMEGRKKGWREGGESEVSPHEEERLLCMTINGRKEEDRPD